MKKITEKPKTISIKKVLKEHKFIKKYSYLILRKSQLNFNNEYNSFEMPFGREF
jgi:hypothetical protein